jgi:hypothetical protein
VTGGKLSGLGAETRSTRVQRAEKYGRSSKSGFGDADIAAAEQKGARDNARGLRETKGGNHRLGMLKGVQIESMHGASATRWFSFTHSSKVHEHVFQR